jgi:hypothetical protein
MLPAKDAVIEIHKAEGVVYPRAFAHYDVSVHPDRVPAGVQMYDVLAGGDPLA